MVIEAVAGQQLHVAQRAAGLMDQARCPGDEGAPARMRRAAVEADRTKGPREPQHDAARSHASAALRRDDGAGGHAHCAPGEKRLPQLRMQRDAAAGSLLGGVIAQLDAGGKVAVAGEHHVPGEAGNLARPQARLDREQDNQPIAVRVPGRTRVDEQEICLFFG